MEENDPLGRFSIREKSIHTLDISSCGEKIVLKQN